MRLLLDQHLSRSLVAPLQPAFPGTSHIALHALDQSDDAAIWDFALKGGFVITTKDDDFHLLSFTRGHPPKVIWLRSGNGPTRQVQDILLRARALIEHFNDDENQSLLILP